MNYYDFLCLLSRQFQLKNSVLLIKGIVTILRVFIFFIFKLNCMEIIFGWWCKCWRSFGFFYFLSLELEFGGKIKYLLQGSFCSSCWKGSHSYLCFGSYSQCRTYLRCLRCFEFELKNKICVFFNNLFRRVFFFSSRIFWWINLKLPLPVCKKFKFCYLKNQIFSLPFF